ncbi:hypothetical protein D3C85_1699110 [compost metagenome]
MAEELMGWVSAGVPGRGGTRGFYDPGPLRGVHEAGFKGFSPGLCMTAVSFACARRLKSASRNPGCAFEP